MEATKEDKPKRESTQEYLKSLGLGGNSKRQQKRAAADAEERKKKDFTADVDAACATADKLVSENKLEDALQTLLPMEKKTRLVQDSAACSTVVLKMLSLIFAANEWKKLSETVTMIAKRRSALQKVVYKMVVQAMEYLTSAPTQDIKIELIGALRKVTEGKIFVELEEARLARMLAEIKEKQGEIAEAANILQEVSVETCGSMEAREKAEFMLEQVRLCLAKKDWVRSKIMSKKLKRNVLTEQGFHDLKLTHCSLATKIHIHEDDMLALANDFLSVFNTPTIQEDDNKWSAALQRVVLFVVLAPFGKDQADLLQRTCVEKKIDLLPEFQNLLTKFTTMEIIHWNDILKLNNIVQHDLFTGIEWSNEETKEISTERSNQYLKMFELRTTEHNVRVITKYYSKISIQRMSDLLSMKIPKLEDVLSNMVSDHVITCKIDRPAGIISFKKLQTSDSVLDEWSNDVSSLLNLVEQTCYLIQRENMIHETKK